MGMMWKGKGKGKGKMMMGGGPKPTPDLTRTRITTAPITGEVTKWVKDKFGWIKPTTPIDHPNAKKNKGKIFVSVKDLADGSTSLKEGAHVCFQAYSDESGLGAEEVVSSCR